MNFRMKATLTGLMVVGLLGGFGAKSAFAGLAINTNYASAANAGCSTDDDCASMTHRTCTEVHCLPSSTLGLITDTGTTTASKTCQAVPSKDPACEQCSQYKDAASGAVSDAIGYRCCSLGFDETKEPDDFACCRKAFSGFRPISFYGQRQMTLMDANAYQDKRLAGSLLINGSYNAVRYIYKYIYAQCQSCQPPPYDCSKLFSDPDHQACCNKAAAAGAKPSEMVAMCMTSDDCNNTLNINITNSTNVTVCGIQQCCQAVHAFVINNTDIEQKCSNIPSCGGTPGTPPPPAPPAPPTGTTPSGSPTPQSACSCTPPPDAMIGGKAIAFGPDKAPTPFLCTLGGGLSTTAPLTVTVTGQGKPVPPDSSATLSADGMTMTLAPGSTKFTVNSNLTLSGYDASNALGTANVSVTDGTATEQCPIQVAISVEGHGAASSGGCSLIRK